MLLLSLLLMEEDRGTAGEVKATGFLRNPDGSLVGVDPSCLVDLAPEMPVGEEGGGETGAYSAGEDLYYNPDGTDRLYAELPTGYEPPVAIPLPKEEPSIDLEEYCPDGVHLRCTRVFPEGHEKAGTQCTQWATARSVKRGGPNLCDMHGGGGGAPAFPEMPDLLGNIRQIDEWLDAYKGMSPHDLDKDEFAKFRQLLREKTAAFESWRKYEKGIWSKVDAHLAEERDWFMGKVLEAVRVSVRSRATRRDLMARLKDIGTEADGREGGR